MAEEGNRRGPVRLADSESPGAAPEPRNLKRGKDLWNSTVTGPAWVRRIGTNVALHAADQYVKPHLKQ